MEDRLLQQVEERFASQQRKTDEQLVAMMQILKNLEKKVASSEDSEHPSPRFSAGFHENHNHHPRTLGYTPKLEFPTFDGNNARMWIRKCEKYFSLCKVSDEQKLDLACIYVNGKAESWVSSYISAKRGVTWSEFIIDLCARFRDDHGEYAVEQFKKLCQKGSIEECLDEFEEMRALLMQKNHLLSDEFFLESFIGGMKASIKPFVRAFKPKTISEAVEFARLQEESLACNSRNAVKPSQFLMNKPSFTSVNASPSNSNTSLSANRSNPAPYQSNFAKNPRQTKYILLLKGLKN